MINLLSQDYKKSIHRELKVRAISYWVILFSVVFIFLSVVSFPAFFLQKTRKDIAEKQNTEIIGETVDGSPEFLLSQISEINSSVSGLLSKLAPSGINVDMFKIVLAPDTISIKIEQIYLEERDGSSFIKVSGIASSREALLEYSSALKSQKLCEDFSAPVSSLAKSEDIDFIIDCQVKL